MHRQHNFAADLPARRAEHGSSVCVTTPSVEFSIGTTRTLRDRFDVGKDVVDRGLGARVDGMAEMLVRRLLRVGTFGPR